MPITIEQVEYVARLARLALDEEEKKRLAAQMSAILEYVEKLSEVDVSDVEPTSHVLPLVNVMREDVVVPPIPREKALLNAPDEEDGQFRVPAVLD